MHLTKCAPPVNSLSRSYIPAAIKRIKHAGIAFRPTELALCKQLVVEAKLGLAPGNAFGPEGEGYVRWCFASSLERLDDGVKRLARFMEKRASLRSSQR